ncbi:MAG: Bax inhibitor-1/YccA family protein [Prevotella sp.]|nr:Bax inhibitor-1/YccA family protein [Candidatus Equicola faecalis]
MNYNNLMREGYTSDELRMVNTVLPSLMRKVYTWMTLAMVITALTAYGVAHNPTLLQMIYSSSFALILLCVVELGLVFYLSARISTLSLTTATIMFIVYSALNGVVLSSVFIIYTQESLVQVFLVTACTFAVMALFGYRTSRNLSKVGQILFMALIGLIIATVVNIFLKSSGLNMILNYLGILIFVGLTAWDSQKIKHMLMACEDMGEGAQKVALLGSLTLYLDFINLFLYLLRIFGRRD